MASRGRIICPPWAEIAATKATELWGLTLWARHYAAPTTSLHHLQPGSALSLHQLSHRLAALVDDFHLFLVQRAIENREIVH